MATVKLSIQAQLCGPVSIGTVDVIKAVQTYAGLGLGEAKALVDPSLTDAPPIDVRID
jgi:hypothetical protein